MLYDCESVFVLYDCRGGGAEELVAVEFALFFGCAFEGCTFYWQLFHMISWCCTPIIGIGQWYVIRCTHDAQCVPREGAHTYCNLSCTSGCRLPASFLAAQHSVFIRLHAKYPSVLT